MNLNVVELANKCIESRLQFGARELLSKCWFRPQCITLKHSDTDLNQIFMSTALICSKISIAAD